MSEDGLDGEEGVAQQVRGCKLVAREPSSTPIHPPTHPTHLDGRETGRQAQAGVVAVGHDDATHHARAHAPAALVHVLRGREERVDVV